MPAEELRVDLAQEITRDLFFIFTPGHLPDAQSTNGVGRRLTQGAGVRRRGWGIWELPRAGPVLGAREVALRRGLRVEDDVGYLAVPPLVLEQGEQLPGGAAGVEVR